MASKGTGGRGGAPFSKTTGTSPFPQIPGGRLIKDPPQRPAQGLKTPTKAPVVRDLTSGKPNLGSSSPSSGINKGQ